MEQNPCPIPTDNIVPIHRQSLVRIWIATTISSHHYICVVYIVYGILDAGQAHLPASPQPSLVHRNPWLLNMARAGVASHGKLMQCVE